MQWIDVDETGHVPGVAAELPTGHKVLLDASGNIGAIVLVEPMANEIAPDNDAAVAPAQEE